MERLCFLFIYWISLYKNKIKWYKRYDFIYYKLDSQIIVVIGWPVRTDYRLKRCRRKNGNILDKLCQFGKLLLCFIRHTRGRRLYWTNGFFFCIPPFLCLRVFLNLFFLVFLLNNLFVKRFVFKRIFKCFFLVESLRERVGILYI